MLYKEPFNFIVIMLYKEPFVKGLFPYISSWYTWRKWFLYRTMFLWME